MLYKYKTDLQWRNHTVAVLITQFNIAQTSFYFFIFLGAHISLIQSLAQHQHLQQLIYFSPDI